jgi:HEPN domain-containing protein
MRYANKNQTLVEGFAEEFEDDWRDAKAYHRRALQFLSEGTRSSLVFNVASVALERYLVAICDMFGAEPWNHNYNQLMNAVEPLIDVDPHLDAEIRSLDQIFGICSIESYHHGVPEPEDAGRVLRMCDQVSLLIEAEI